MVMLQNRLTPTVERLYSSLHHCIHKHFIMKQLTNSLPALAGLALASLAAPSLHAFATFARGALTLDTQLSLNYDSYFIGATKIGDDDYFVSLTPTFNYRRSAGLAPISISTGVSVQRYDTYDNYDSENFFASFNTKFPTPEGARIQGDINLGYRESTDVDQFVNDRISSKSTSLGLNGSYQSSLKTRITESASYSIQDSSGYSEQKTFTNNLGFIYSNFLGATNFGMNYQFTDNQSTGGPLQTIALDQQSHSLSSSLTRPLWGPLNGGVTYGYRWLDRSAQETAIGQRSQNAGFFSLNLDGPFLPPAKFPKIKSNASLSYQESLTPGVDDTGGKTVTGDISLSWNARERTQISIAASRSLQLSATNRTVENTSLTLGVTESVGDFTRLNASLSQNWNSFRGINREDKIFRGTLGATRSIGRNWSLSSNYTYEKNKTDTDLAAQSNFRFARGNYERHLISLSGIYSF